MVQCKSKNVIFAMDTTTTLSKDHSIMDNIQSKLEAAGFNVTRVHEPSRGSDKGRGPNALANNYSYAIRKGITNSIIFNLMNGVDPSNIKEAYQSDSNRGDGYWYAQQALKPKGNVAVLGWFYGACDFITVHANDRKHCYYSVRGSESHGGRFYNPKQKMDENGVLYVLDRDDHDGSSIAQKFIDLVNENMGETTSTSNTSNTSDTSNGTTTEEKTLSEQIITQYYTNAHYQRVVTAKTDEKGAFQNILDLNIPGKYSININYAGAKKYNGTTTTVEIENYKGTQFQHVLLQTDTTSKYTDGTSEVVTNGAIGGETFLKIVTTTHTYENGVLKETKTETTTTNGIDVIKPATSDIINPSNTATGGGQGDPFTSDVALNNGVPSVSGMSHGGKAFAMVDLTKSYTLTKAQYKEVIDRDSKMVQLNNYVESKYTAFQSETEPNKYIVLERERWNAVEEALNYYLVKGDGRKGLKEYAPWPEKMTIDFSNHKSTFDGTSIDWKGETCTYWFVADNQDAGRTCGPTACSVVSQILHKYHSEKNFDDSIHANANGGSGPESHRTAFISRGFTAEMYSGISAAVSWLRENKPVVYHTRDHYIALADINDGNTSGVTISCSNIKLEKGSSGDNVKAAQTLLKQYGYYSGEPTGNYDDTTVESVKSYQRAKGLTVDGWIGPVTCNSLNGSTGTRILVCNSVQSATDTSTYGPPSGWKSYTNLKNRAFGSAVKVGLAWTISEEEKNNLNHFYNSMGGAWSKPANTNESVRMYHLSGY